MYQITESQTLGQSLGKHFFDVQRILEAFQQHFQLIAMPAMTTGEKRELLEAAGLRQTTSIKDATKLLEDAGARIDLDASTAIERVRGLCEQDTDAFSDYDAFHANKPLASSGSEYRVALADVLRAARAADFIEHTRISQSSLRFQLAYEPPED